MFCNNCGERGHVFKTCKYPIISCGLVLLKGTKEPFNLPVEDTNDVRMLMVRRKDSMSYMEFLRGKYDMTNPDYIHRLIQNMTMDEQRRIVEMPFLNLWTLLWGDGRDVHSPEFYDAKEKFEALDRCRLVYEYRSFWNEPEWGFPKGRRMRGETDVDCAIREFYEETNISRGAYTLCKNLEFEEVFTGTNNVTYKHVYFIGFLTKEIDVKQKLTAVQRREISLVQWMSFDESRRTIRPHYTRRMEVLNEIAAAVQTFETLAQNQ
jgi:8-oxo-dGTP pyrophosphatase MutT (NUDIX family)